MQVKYFASFVLAGLASAQSLQEIISQNSNLTTLAGLLNQTGLLAELGNASNITVLAPSNDAFSVFLNESATMAQMQSDPGLVQAVLEYHVLAGTIRSTDITTTPAFAKTMLTHMTYTNVTGGQVVKAQAVDSNVVFTSGLLMRSNVTQADIGFDGGVVHIIDSVLTVPQNDSATAVAANLTALAGALTQAGLVATVDAAMDVTIFAPSNAGFAAISNLVGSLSMEQLTQILTYHVVSGTVGYSTTLMNGMTIPTLDGNATVTITVDNGTIFVNSAKVVTADVLLNNGVAHVIDNVLNPNNSTATTNPTATSDAPAFSGAAGGSGSSVPFTSAVTATGTAASTSASQGGVAMQTAAVGAAALFGGAAFLVNL